jgi:hypothetical protein
MQPKESMHLGTIAIKGICSEQMYENVDYDKSKRLIILTDENCWTEILSSDKLS